MWWPNACGRAIRFDSCAVSESVQRCWEKGTKSFTSLWGQGLPHCLHLYVGTRSRASTRLLTPACDEMLESIVDEWLIWLGDDANSPSLSLISSSERSSYCKYVWTEQDGLSVSVGLLACQQRTEREKVRLSHDLKMHMFMCIAFDYLGILCIWKPQIIWTYHVNCACDLYFNPYAKCETLSGLIIAVLHMIYKILLDHCNCA